jgi:MFS family permease
VGVGLVRRVGFHRTAALGIAAVAIAAGLVAALDVDTPGQALLAVAAIGIGLGFALPPASDAILAATPPDKAGVGSALTDAALQVGGSLGVAVLGSVLVEEYRGAVAPSLTALPEPAAAAVTDSVAAAQPVADQLPADTGRPLLASVAQAFVDGQQAAMLVAVGVAVVGVVIARTRAAVAGPATSAGRRHQRLRPPCRSGRRTRHPDDPRPTPSGQVHHRPRELAHVPVTHSEGRHDPHHEHHRAHHGLIRLAPRT